MADKIINICGKGEQLFGLDDEGKLWILEYNGGVPCWNLVVKDTYDNRPKIELLNEEA